MEQENEGQRALRLWLTAGLAIPEVTQLHIESDAKYILGNMIRKYTLAARTYKISKVALLEFNRRGVDLTQRWARSRYHGKKLPFIYEHSVPASVIRKALLDSDRSASTAQRILRNSGYVAVLLREENKKLQVIGLNQKMPIGWKLGDGPSARYRCAGIEISAQVLKVKGAIAV